MAKSLVSSDLTRGCQSVEFWQTQVHQDNRGLFLKGDSDGLFAIGGLNNYVTGHLKQLPHHEAAVLEILHDQKCCFLTHVSSGNGGAIAPLPYDCFQLL